MLKELDDPTRTSLLESGRTLTLATGQVLFNEGDPSEHLFFVLSGRLQVRAETGPKPITLGAVHPSGVVGEMTMLRGGRRSATVLAAEESEVLEVDRASFETCVAQSPTMREALMGLSHERLRRNRLLSVLRIWFEAHDEAIIQELASRCTFLKVSPGTRLIASGEPSTDLYLVLKGRLEIRSPHASTPEVVGSLRPGDIAGETGLLTNLPRSADVVATAVSELAQLSASHLFEVVRAEPTLLTRLTELTLHRARATAGPHRSLRGRSIALVALDDSVGDAFFDQLAQALGESFLSVRPEKLASVLGLPDCNVDVDTHSPADYQLEAWLDAKEASSEGLLLRAGNEATPWLERCLARAQHLVLAGDATRSPKLRAIESKIHELSRQGVISRISLVLLHPDDGERPAGTRVWLEHRKMDQHHHVRKGRKEDFERVARWVADKPVIVVLGGGGALGAVHLGVLQALREAQVPIDGIAGVSAGAGVGALAAMGKSPSEAEDLLKHHFVHKNPFFRLTLPVVSLVSGQAIDRTSKAIYGSVDVEDLWTPFFCIASSLTRSQLRVLAEGPLWRAVRASCAVPGVVPPCVIGEELLVDGGMVDNLPVAAVRERWPGRIVAVNLSLTEQPVEPNAHREWETKVPTIASTMLKTLMLPSRKSSQTAKELSDALIEPPLEGYGIASFGAFDELQTLGFEHTARICEDLGRALGLGDVVRPPTNPLGRRDGEPSGRSLQFTPSPGKKRRRVERRVAATKLDRHTSLAVKMLGRGVRSFVRTPPQAIRPPSVDCASVRMESVRAFGQEPLDLLALDEDAPIRPKWLRGLVQANNRTAPFVDQADSWLSRDEARLTLEDFFGDLLPACPVEWDDPNAPGALEQFILQGIGCHRVERRVSSDGVHRYVLPMESQSRFAVRSGFAPYGGDAHLGSDGQVTHIHWRGRDVSEQDRDWSHARFLFRSSVLTFVTIADHLVGSHYVVSNGLALATYRHLSPHHPLRAFLKPFLFRTGAINHGALQSLIPQGALVHRMTALTYTSLLDCLQRSRRDVKVLPFDASLRAKGMHPDELPAHIREKHTWGYDGMAYWGRLLDFVQDAFQRSAALRSVLSGPRRAETEAFWAALGEGPGLPRAPLDAPNLVLALASYIFEVTAAHGHAGCVAPYIRDSSFAAGRVRPGSVSTDRQNSFQLCTVGAITGLDIPRVGEDWTHLMPDLEAKQAAAGFRTSLREWQEELDARNARRTRACTSFSPRHMPCSVSR